MLIEGTSALASLYGTTSLVHVCILSMVQRIEIWYSHLEKSLWICVYACIFLTISVTSHKVLESWTFCKEVHRKFNEPQIFRKRKLKKIYTKDNMQNLERLESFVVLKAFFFFAVKPLRCIYTILYVAARVLQDAY